MNPISERFMKLQGWIMIAATAILVPACSHIKKTDLDVSDFDGVEFISNWTKSETVQLDNGEYREQAAPGSATEIVVRLNNKFAPGTINGKEAIVVILVTNPGGSGTFHDLALLIKEDDVWINKDLATLGDRVEVQGLSMEGNLITVHLITHGPSDPMCCPTLKKELLYTIEEDRLVEKKSSNSNLMGGQLLDIEWRWQQTLYNDDRKSIPPKPENYTLLLTRDGRISARIDCNRGGGTYTLEGSRITIEIAHMTMAACPPGSLDRAFLKDLSAAAIYFIKNGDLYLDLKYDTGTMKFVR